MTDSTPANARPSRRRSPWVVVLLCWLVVVFDGYDLIVYGTTIPPLLKEPGWGLTPSSAGTIGSLAFAGMLVGALGAGYLADRIGRRRTIIWATLWFSVFSTLCAVAPSAEVFGLLRFVAGIGLGGLVPSANALTAEFVGDRHRSVVATVMMSGVPIGGSIAALLGLVILPGPGWRAMYAVGAVAVVVLLPVCVWLLPESPTWLRSQGRIEEAARGAARYGLPDRAAPAQARPSFATVIQPPWRKVTVLFSLATVVTLFAWYGLATWLPKLMASDHRFDLGKPLTFLLALNIGAVIGSTLTAWAGVRFGPLRSAAGAAFAAGVALSLLLTYPSQSSAVYAALIVAGIGTHGTQCLILAAIAGHYPPELRGTALGFALGFGRIGAVLAPQVGGWLIDAKLGVGSNFLTFSLAAVAAAVLLWTTSLAVRPGRRTEPQTAVA
ncbi:aromatic acid/H+ symport family MFS transporter [Calidifontibacter sp. DB0510]|uniref:Aromatic acid/H+ symport family MFS transporter n=1 Tax=Metallococcus carri TaxID=1656884 RepID=A0A967E7K3_9MICO|nr:aromatic acid/H+ symport family MFS transporter [Metallococcus carri]NHN54227.1 aromatic acid/H+ symport family MFS transporter [Metallococcus carri]NOP36933.1 aromatic acid/H+ symport family MFS transporter [Calidifontibacter sp. DB2511S]